MTTTRVRALPRPWMIAVATLAAAATASPRELEHEMASIPVDIRLNHPAEPYSFGEDVIVEVEIWNRGDRPVEVPWFRDSEELVLRLKPEGGPMVEKNTLRFDPGVPVGSESMQLDPGEGGVVRLSLQEVFGALAPGRHSLQIDVRSPLVKTTTAWMPFVVGPRDVGPASLSVSLDGQIKRAFLAWQDAGLTPHRILWKAYGIRRRDLLLRAEGGYASYLCDVPDGAGAIALPFTAAGNPPTESWVAWTEGRTLRYIRVRDGKLVADHRQRLDADLDAVNPALVHPEGTADRAPLAVLLASRRGSPQPLLVGMDFDADGKLLTSHRLAPEHPPLAVALTHLSPDRRWVAWTEAGGEGKERIRIARWERQGGFSQGEDVQEVSGHVDALAVVVRSHRLWVAALVTTPQPTREQPERTEVALVRAEYGVKLGLDPAVILSWGGKHLMLDRGWPHGAKRWKLASAPRRTQLLLLPDGIAVGLVETRDGLVGVSTEEEEPRALVRAEGAQRHVLFPLSDRDIRMLWLDAKAGWKTGRVPGG